MKINQLKDIIKESVRDVIREELRDILLEAVKSNKQPIQEVKSNSSINTPVSNSGNDLEKRKQIRESYMNVLGDMKSQFTTQNIPQPLQVNGPMDTTSPNGKLPEGEVSLDQVMGLMNK
jgi:hypothetical protein